jgi:hypothetical protein
MRAAPAPIRGLLACALALVLALRLLMPAGFMPAFDRGAVTIVICPDADPSEVPVAGHHHHAPKKLHQPCPYASAAALGGLIGEHPLLEAMLAIGLALLLGRTFSFLERQREHERPPLRGPPIPA